MSEIDLVIFDLAGTTVKDGGQVPAAFASALAEQGVSVTPEMLNGVRGSSKREAILRFLPDVPDRARRAESAFASFREHLAGLYTRAGVEPVEGTAQTFDWLRLRGVKVALNTGFDRDTTALLLDALRWGEGAVDAVVCGDDVSQGRPAPYMIFRAMEAAGASSVRRVMSVGDTTLDLRAGDNAGVRWNVGVLTGAHTREKLEITPHTHIINSVAELPVLFEMLTDVR